MIANNLSTIDLTSFGLIQVSGLKNSEFLQGQLSCDVTEVTSTQSRLGVHCNAKGRVLATFYLFYKAPHYYFFLPRSMVSFLLKDLGRYAPFSKVILEDKSDAFEKTGWMGEGVPMLRDDYSLQLENHQVYTDETVTWLNISGVVPRVIRIGSNDSENLQIPLQSFAHWEKVDILSGIASVYPETRGLFTPHHLNYHKKGGISFAKGCYTGQEVIARMHYLGKLKQQIYQFDLNSTILPQRGADILDAKGNAQGTLIMIVPLLNVGSKALGVIQDAAITENLYCEGVLLENIEKTKD